MNKWNYKKPDGCTWDTQEEWNQTLYVKLNEVAVSNRDRIIERPFQLKIPNKFKPLIESLEYYSNNKIGPRYVVEFIESDYDIIGIGDYGLEIINYLNDYSKKQPLDDLVYIDYITRFTNKINKTNDLILLSLRLMKENSSLTMREAIDDSLLNLDIKLDNSI